MASTYSPNLRIELIGTGEQAGTWGTTTNTNLGTLLEGAIAGYTTVSVTSANQALTTSNGGVDQARPALLRFTTTTAANFNVYAPPVSKIYIIANDSGYSATIYNSTVIGNTTAAGLGVTIPTGAVVQVWSDGTNFSSTDLVDPILANSAVVSSASTGTALTVTQTGTGNAFVVQDESPDTTPFVIDNSGRVISGYTTYRAFNYAATPRFQINGTDATSGAITSVISSATAAESGSILLGRSRGSQASPSGLSSGDDVGRVQFEGYAGSAMLPAAAIIAQADGGVGATDMPGRLTFWTTLDGTATLTERMRIDNAGRVGIGGAPLGGASTSSALVLTRDLENATSAAFGMYANGAVKATTTSVASYYGTGVSTASNSGSAYTIPSLYHFSTAQGTFHADSTVTNQYGFVVSNNLTGATTNVGVYGNLSANTDATISTVAVATNVVTIATTIAHGFKTGQLVEIRTATHPQLDGVFTVASTPSTTTFTYALTTPNISPAEADTGTAFNLSRWFIYNNASAPSWFAGRAILDVSSSAPALRITQRGTGNAITVEDSTNPDTTPFIVDTNGNIISGYTSSLSTAGATYKYQIHGANPWVGIRWEAVSTGPTALIAKSRSATVGSYSIVSSGDTLGTLAFAGDDGAGFVQAAAISSAVDGTPGLNDMPGRLVFSTTLDGASSPTERMRITNAGNLLVNETSARTIADRSARVQLSGTDAASSSASSTRWSADASPSAYTFGKSRGATVGTNGVVLVNDSLGMVQFAGNDGTNFITAARILGEVDGTPGTNDMPGRLTFWTTLDGASSATERMRIDNGGRVAIGGTPGGNAAFTQLKNLSAAGGSTGYSILNSADVDPVSVTNAVYYGTSAATSSNSGVNYTVANLQHYNAAQGTFDADSTVTTQIGLNLGSNLTGAISNYGIYSGIPELAPANISTVAVATNVVTIVTTAAHGFTTGQRVEVKTATHPFLNCVATITVVNSTTFTYSRTTANISPAEADAGAIYSLANLATYSVGTAPSQFSGRVIVDVSTGADALRITQRGGGNALVIEDVTNQDSTPFIVDTDGCVVLGSQTRYGTYSGTTPWLQLINSSTGQSSILMQGTASGSGTAPILNIANASSTNAGVVASGNTLGAIRFYGGDGAGPILAAQIECRSDGTPGVNDMPGRISFLTTPSGSSSPLERMRINNAGEVGIGTASLTGAVLSVGKNITGGTTAIGVVSSGQIQSDVAGGSSAAWMFRSSPSTVAASFTLNTLLHFGIAPTITFGAGTTVNTQYGFASSTGMTGATTNIAFIAQDIGGAAATTGKTNYGFYSNVSTSTGGGTAWNFYANGTAPNFFQGNVGVVGSLGYTTGAGGTVTQATSRITGVTLNKVTGAITLVSAAGSATWQSFTVTNSTVAATDTIIVNQKSGTDLYMIHVTAVAAGSFRITFATTGGTTTEQPVFNFAVIKGVTS